MGLAARFLKLVRKAEDKSMSDYLSPVDFDECVSAAKELPSPSNTDLMEHPSTALKVGYNLTRLASIKMRLGIKFKNEDMVKEAELFLALVKLEWGFRVTRHAAEIIMDRNFSKKKCLPYPEDIKAFSYKMIANLEKYKYEDISLNFREVQYHICCVTKTETRRN